MPDRRTSIRVPVNLKTSIQVRETVTSAQTGTTLDLSNGGMRLSGSQPLAPGREVSVSFELPTEGQVVGQGLVVWCGESKDGSEGYQAGIRWLQVHPTAQARINAFLAQRTQDRPPFSVLAPQDSIHWGKVLWTAFLISIALAGVAMLWLDRLRLSTGMESLKTHVGSTDQLVHNFLNRLFHSR